MTYPNSVDLGLSQVELLAPAGSMECLHAAVSAGADAVYLGLGDFNARRRADNFTIESLAEACDYAHLRGVRIYITLNIAILPSEFARAIDFARDAYLAGADAFIVQDIGLACALRESVPQAQVHVSTQMNVHSAAGIEVAARLGASRVTLARELSLAEVADLASIACDFGMDVEVFAHGALCVCYSGQCLMSSMIGGRSANRGLCAQACRLAYDLHVEGREEPLPSEGEHLLSPRDLCTVDMLGELIDAGVASFKIEGRMKSADYVYAVVSVYRAVLDRELAARAEGKGGARATDEEHGRLSEAFSRGFTTAYLTSNRGNDIMSYGRPNNRGVLVGRVASVRDGLVAIDVDCEVHAGDVLEFWTNRGHFAETLATLEFDKQGRVVLAASQRVGKGDRVFRVRNAAECFTDDALGPRISVQGTVELALGECAHVAFSRPNPWTGEVQEAGAWGAVVEPAKTKALTEDDVVSHVDRLGQTPYLLEKLDVSLDEGAGIGFSQLHHLRADALDALSELALADYRCRTEADFGPRLGHLERVRRKRLAACEVVALVSNPACARAVRRAGVDAIYVPALNYKRGQSQLEGVLQTQADQAGYPKQCVMVLPTIDHDPVPGTREYALDTDPWKYVREGARVMVDSMASLVRACSMGCTAELGPHVPVLNAQAARVACDMGAARIWLSPELTLGQIADISDTCSAPLGLVVAGNQEVMVMEHCALMSQGACNEQCQTCARRQKRHYLKDRKGFDFPVVTDALGRSHIYNGVALDAVSCLPDLISMGVEAVMVDTTLMSEREAGRIAARVVKARDLAFKTGEALEKQRGTTTGHLFRGVS